MEKHTVHEPAAQPWVNRFGGLPVIGQAIYGINPDIPTEFLFSEAQCLIDSMAEVALDGVQEPMSGAAAWMLESNLERVSALLYCIEAQWKRSKADVPADSRMAA